MTPDYQTPERMAAKLKAIPLPFMFDKTVLDVGCDMGFWSFLAAEKGARTVLGLDRNREVKGAGRVDLVALNNIRATDEGRGHVSFAETNLGKQWREFGQFSVVLCFSMYHHFYSAAGGDHSAVFFWLWRHCQTDGVLMWEGPVDCSDSVVRRNVLQEYHSNYTRAAIIAAAETYFNCQLIGPALHEPTREVWRMTPRSLVRRKWRGRVKDGAGGAAAAFLHSDGRRIKEIDAALGFKPFPGSLNLRGEIAFEWDHDYYRAEIHDVGDRRGGLDQPWIKRWARFYPVKINSVKAFAFRFEGEHYRQTFVELIAPTRLRDVASGPGGVSLCR